MSCLASPLRSSAAGPGQGGGRRLSVDPYIEMVSLGKNPRVAIRDGAKIKRKIRLLVRNRRSDLKRKALREPGTLRAQAPYLAACSIGADQKTGLIGLPAVINSRYFRCAQSVVGCRSFGSKRPPRSFSPGSIRRAGSDRHHAVGSRLFNEDDKPPPSSRTRRTICLTTG